MKQTKEERYNKCEKCLANYPEGKEHICDPLMKGLVDFKKSKSEQLIKEIRECCPELMELSMGCKIIFKEKAVLNEAKVLRRNDAGNYLVEIFAVTTTIKENNIVKIIGHPIHLEHLLRYFKKIKRPVRITENGYLEIGDIDKDNNLYFGVTSTFIDIELLIPLEQQTEALEKIANLIL